MTELIHLVASLLSWPVILAYLFIGWVVYGGMLFFRDVPGGKESATLLTCLAAWPFPLALQVLAALHTVATWIFHPDTGPIAAFLNVLKRAFHVRASAPPPAPPAAGAS